jgi:hypothetical protein
MAIMEVTIASSPAAVHLKPSCAEQTMAVPPMAALQINSGQIDRRHESSGHQSQPWLATSDVVTAAHHPSEAPQAAQAALYRRDKIAATAVIAAGTITHQITTAWSRFTTAYRFIINLAVILTVLSTFP